MIKAIVYHRIEEKEALERELKAAIPKKRYVAVSKALMNIFSNSKKRSVKKQILEEKTMIGE